MYNLLELANLDMQDVYCLSVVNMMGFLLYDNVWFFIKVTVTQSNKLQGVIIGSNYN